MSDRLKAAAEAVVELELKWPSIGKSAPVGAIEQALKPFIPEPSGDMKKCAGGLGKIVDDWMFDREEEGGDWGALKERFSALLSRHWPDKLELDIDGVFNDVGKKVGVDECCDALNVALMDAQLNKTMPDLDFKSILSTYWPKDQGCDEPNAPFGTAPLKKRIAELESGPPLGDRELHLQRRVWELGALRLQALKVCLKFDDLRNFHPEECAFMEDDEKALFDLINPSREEVLKIEKGEK